MNRVHSRRDALPPVGWTRIMRKSGPGPFPICWTLKRGMAHGLSRIFILLFDNPTMVGEAEQFRNAAGSAERGPRGPIWNTQAEVDETRFFYAGNDGMRKKWPWIVVLGMLVLGACKSKESLPPPGGEPNPDRGRRVYLTTCTECHNPNPANAGPIGPAVKGSSEELLRARVMTATYPVGYKPKRKTAAMDPIPEMEPYIRDLAAFLK